MRQYLVTKFVCAKCGGMLNLSSDVPKRHEGSSSSTDGVTGALKVEAIFAIEPCRKCLEPARKIMEAMEILRGEEV